MQSGGEEATEEDAEEPQREVPWEGAEDVGRTPAPHQTTTQLQVKWTQRGKWFFDEGAR